MCRPCGGNGDFRPGIKIGNPPPVMVEEPIITVNGCCGTSSFAEMRRRGNGNGSLPFLRRIKRTGAVITRPDMEFDATSTWVGDMG